MTNRAINWARLQTGIGSSAKFVLWVIADCFREKDNAFVAWPTYEQIENDTNLSPRTIRRALHELADAGLVVMEHRRDSDGRMMGVWYYLPLFDNRSVPPIDSGDSGENRGPGEGRKHRPGNGSKSGQTTSDVTLTTGHPDREPPVILTANTAQPPVSLTANSDRLTGGTYISLSPLLNPLPEPLRSPRGGEQFSRALFTPKRLDDAPDVAPPRLSRAARDAWGLADVAS